jgi:4-amino-4-deoxy-L-arabinose transferase-like glycosyltransferase
MDLRGLTTVVFPAGWSAARRRVWEQMAILALALGALYLGGHAAYGLFDVDEAVFTQATREMTLSRDWTIPTYNGEPRYDKPPLIYWLQAGAMRVWGPGSLYAARLPSALCALAEILLLGWGVWRLTGNRRWALMSAAVLGLNVSYLVIGRAATADAAMNLLSLALVLAVLLQIYRPWKGRWKAWGWVPSMILAGLGLLAKGPVAWVGAGLVGLTLLAMRKDRATVWQRVRPWHIGGFGVALLLPWLVGLVQVHGAAFFTEFLLVQNGQRFFGGFHNTQSHSLLYYPLVVLLGFLPWSLFLPRAAWWAVRKWRAHVASPQPALALPALSVAWALGVVALFTFSHTKLAHYVLPAWPALSIIVGGWLAEPNRGRDFTLMGPLGVLLLGVLGLALVGLAPALHSLQHSTYPAWLAGLQGILGFGWPPHDPLALAVLGLPVKVGPAPLAAGLVLLLAVIPAWWRVRLRGRRALLGLLGAWTVVLGLLAYGLVPVVWAYTQKPLAVLAQEIRDLPPSVPVIHLGLHKPSVLYLSGRPFTKLEKPLQLPDYVPARDPVAVLTEQPTVAEVRRELSHAVIDSQGCLGGYCLLLVRRVAAAPVSGIDAATTGDDHGPE